MKTLFRIKIEEEVYDDEGSRDYKQEKRKYEQTVDVIDMEAVIAVVNKLKK
jgi:hypothetical protein